MAKSDRKKGYVAICISTELADRAEALASRTGRARDDIIAGALSLGLRGAERDQSIVDLLEEFDAGHSPASS